MVDILERGSFNLEHLWCHRCRRHCSVFSLVENKATPSLSVLFKFAVSIISLILRGEVISPTPNPQTGGSGFFFQGFPSLSHKFQLFKGARHLPFATVCGISVNTILQTSLSILPSLAIYCIHTKDIIEYSILNIQQWFRYSRHIGW